MSSSSKIETNNHPLEPRRSQIPQQMKGNLLSTWNLCNNKIDNFLQHIISNKTEYPSIVNQNNQVDLGIVIKLLKQQNPSKKEGNTKINNLLSAIYKLINDSKGVSTSDPLNVKFINPFLEKIPLTSYFDPNLHITFTTVTDIQKADNKVDTEEYLDYLDKEFGYSIEQLPFLLDMFRTVSENMKPTIERYLQNIYESLPKGYNESKQRFLDILFSYPYKDIETHCYHICLNLFKNTKNNGSDIPEPIERLTIGSYLLDIDSTPIKQDMLDIAQISQTETSSFLYNIINEQEKIYFRKSDTPLSEESINTLIGKINEKLEDKNKLTDKNIAFIRKELNILLVIIEGLQKETPSSVLLAKYILMAEPTDNEFAAIANQILSDHDNGILQQVDEEKLLKYEFLKDPSSKETVFIEKIINTFKENIKTPSDKKKSFNEVLLYSLDTTNDMDNREKLTAIMTAIRTDINDSINGDYEIGSMDEEFINILKENYLLEIYRYRTIPTKKVYNLISFFQNNMYKNGELVLPYIGSVLNYLRDTQIDLAELNKNVPDNTSEIKQQAIILFKTMFNSAEIQDKEQLDLYIKLRIRDLQNIVDLTTVPIGSAILLQDNSQAISHIAIIDQVTAVNNALSLYEFIDAHCDKTNKLTIANKTYLFKLVSQLLQGIEKMRLEDNLFPSSRVVSIDNSQLKYSDNKDGKILQTPEEKDIHSAMDANILLTRAYLHLSNILPGKVSKQDILKVFEDNDPLKKEVLALLVEKGWIENTAENIDSANILATGEMIENGLGPKYESYVNQIKTIINTSRSPFLEKASLMLKELKHNGIGQILHNNKSSLLLKSTPDIADIDDATLFEFNVNALLFDVFLEFSQIDKQNQGYWEKVISDNFNVMDTLLEEEGFLRGVYHLDLKKEKPIINQKNKLYSSIIVGVSYKFIPLMLKLYYHEFDKFSVFINKAMDQAVKQSALSSDKKAIFKQLAIDYIFKNLSSFEQPLDKDMLKVVDYAFNEMGITKESKPKFDIEKEQEKLVQTLSNFKNIIPFNKYTDLFKRCIEINVPKDMFYTSPSSEMANLITLLRNWDPERNAPVAFENFKHGNTLTFPLSKGRIRLNESLNSVYNELALLTKSIGNPQIQITSPKIDTYQYAQDSLGSYSDNIKEIFNITENFINAENDFEKQEELSKNLAIVIYKYIYNLARFGFKENVDISFDIFSDPLKLVYFLSNYKNGHLAYYDPKKLNEQCSDKTYKILTKLSNNIITYFNKPEFVKWKEELDLKLNAHTSVVEAIKDNFRLDTPIKLKQELFQSDGLPEWDNPKNVFNKKDIKFDFTVFQKFFSNMFGEKFIIDKRMQPRIEKILAIGIPYNYTSDYLQLYILAADFPTDEAFASNCIKVLESGYSWLNRYSEYVYLLHDLQAFAELAGNRNAVHKLRCFRLEAVNNLAKNRESEAQRNSTLRTNIHFGIQFIEELAAEMTQEEHPEVWKQQVFIDLITEIGNSFMLLGAMTLQTIDTESFKILATKTLPKELFIKGLEEKGYLKKGRIQPKFYTDSGKQKLDLPDSIKNYEKKIITILRSHISKFELKLYEPSAFNKLGIRNKFIISEEISKFLNSDILSFDKFASGLNKDDTRAIFILKTVGILFNIQKKGHVKLSETDNLTLYKEVEDSYLKALNALSKTDNLEALKFEAIDYLRYLLPKTTENYLDKKMDLSQSSPVNYSLVYKTLMDSMEILSKLAELEIRDEVNKTYPFASYDGDISLEEIDSSLVKINKLIDFTTQVEPQNSYLKNIKDYFSKDAKAEELYSKIGSPMSNWNLSKIIRNNFLLYPDQKKYKHEMILSRLRLEFAYVYLLERKLIANQLNGSVDNPSLKTEKYAAINEQTTQELKSRHSLIGSLIEILQEDDYHPIYEDDKFFKTLKEFKLYQLEIVYKFEQINMDLLKDKTTIPDYEQGKIHFLNVLTETIKQIQQLQSDIQNNVSLSFHIMTYDNELFSFYKQLFDRAIYTLGLHTELFSKEIVDQLKIVCYELLSSTEKNLPRQAWLKHELKRDVETLVFKVKAKQKEKFDGLLTKDLLEYLEEDTSSVRTRSLVY